eukprot:1893114-Amphidinium_carterae.1
MPAKLIYGGCIDTTGCRNERSSSLLATAPTVMLKAFSIEPPSPQVENKCEAPQLGNRVPG